jgi:hypothetical protein
MTSSPTLASVPVMTNGCWLSPTSRTSNAPVNSDNGIVDSFIKDFADEKSA